MNKIRKAFFMVHGSKNIGMGHIFRTLSLASALKAQGCEVVFFSKYSLGIEAIQKNGYDFFKMPAYEKQSNYFDYGQESELEDEIDYINSHFRNETADILIIDSYNVSKKYFTELKKVTKCLVYIDDLNKFKYPVDVLINGTVLTKKMTYLKATPHEKLLLGLKYNLIREDFKMVSIKETKKRTEDIFISTGSSDPCCITEKILGILKFQKYFSKLKFHVIIGKGFPNTALKYKENFNYPNVIFYENPDNMSGIMQMCDLAISSGGCTVYELAASGVPAIVFSYADNQKPQVELLEKDELIKNWGDYRCLANAKLIEYMNDFIYNYQERVKMSLKIQNLIDGKGASRAAEEIIKASR